MSKKVENGRILRVMTGGNRLEEGHNPSIEIEAKRIL